MDLRGPSLEDMTKRAEKAARHMRYSIKQVLISLAKDVNDKAPSADDLIRAQTYWDHHVERYLQPDIRNALTHGADLIHRLFKDDDVPRVTNDYAELYLLTTQNRLSGIGGTLWEVARFQLLDGMAAGEDVTALRNRIRDTLHVTAPRAETIARTEVNGAMNAGSLIQMQSAGLPFTKTWLATGGPRTRPSHARADGQTVEGKNKFIVGGWPMERPHDPNAPAEETENCIIGSTEVDAPLIQVAMRRWFVGDIIVIHTTAGKTLSITPNHPVLTDGGWVAAQQLEVGNHVVRGDVRRQIATQHNEQRGPAVVAEIFDSAAEPSIPEYRERRADFHGERAVCEIHVVAEDRCLGLEVVPALEQEVLEFGLAAADLARLSRGSRQSGLITLGVTGRFGESDGIGITSRSIGGKRLLPAVLNTHRCESNTVSSGHVTNSDTVMTQQREDLSTADTQSMTDGGSGFAIEVGLDDVIGIERLPFAGHVYNLSTTGGWYTSNSIITRNCRCTMTFEIKERVLSRKRQDKKDVRLLQDLIASAADMETQEMTSSCGCDVTPSDGATVLTTDVSSDGGGTVTQSTIERVENYGDDPDEELAGKPTGDGSSCAEGERWDPIKRKCVPDSGPSAEGDTEELGGKPNPGTEKDNRLRKNKIKTRDRKSAGETDDYAVDEIVTDGGYWRGVLAVEGIETGDGREFSSGALTWADTPFPMRWNKEDSHGGEPRTTAVNVGRIDHAWRDPEQSHVIRGSGMFNLQSEDGVRAHQMVKDQFLTGISIDPDNISDADVEYVWAEKPEGSEEDDGEDLLKMLFGRPEKVIFHAGRIRAATLVDIPAFVEAKVELCDGPTEPPIVAEPALTAGAVGVHTTATSDAVWDGALHDRKLGVVLDLTTAKRAYAHVDEFGVDDGHVPKTSCSFIHHEVADDGAVGPANLTACSSGIGVLFGGRGGTSLPETARRVIYAHLAAHLRDAGQEPPPYRDETISAALVAHAGELEWRPPREWFTDPKLGQLTPIIVTDEGRVYGHAAQWGECHLGPQDGSCIMAPRELGHPYYMTGEMITADGGRVAVGQIYTRAAHAQLFLGASAATQHYENTGYVVADIAVGNDRHGIWVAGTVRSDALATRVNELRASGQVSPDWRRIGGQLRMVGMLVVNVSGFQVPRPRAAMHNGQVRALIAAGIPQIGAASALRAEQSARAEQELLDQKDLRRQIAEMSALVHEGRD